MPVGPAVKITLLPWQKVEDPLGVIVAIGFGFIWIVCGKEKPTQPVVGFVACKV